MPEFEALRDQGRDLKNHILEHLDLYLEQFESKVTENGGHVHWARTGEDANQIILDICKQVNAKTVTKGKSMVSEETGLNDFLKRTAFSRWKPILANTFCSCVAITPATSSRRPFT
ncbi:LUD domain-containing protein [Aliamphritea spongicola]|nr:LUD domain-containing protein [Aliamphritea spongicola]